MDPNDKFCLRWNEYENTISTTFKDLRDDEDFTDVTLAAEGDLQVETHRVVLAASSPFFSSLLRRNKKEDRHPLIYLKGVQAKDLLSVVDFMYYGEVNVYQDDLKEFLSVAEELQLRGLRQDDTDEKSSIEENDEIVTTSFVENGNRALVEETDNIEEVIDSMMVRLDGEWTCSACGKKAGKYKNNLRKHVEIVHVDQKGKPCRLCGKIFKSRPNLYAHVRRCQQLSPQRNKVLTYSSFIKTQEINKDDSHSDDDQLATDSVEVDMKCQLQDEEDVELETRIESLMTHLNGDWTCGVCGKNSGKLKANLRKHVEAKHLTGIGLPCNECGREFGSRKALQLHPCHGVPENTFTTSPFAVVKPEITGMGFLCEICNKEFKTNQSLKVHTQAIHEGVKYYCPFCPHSATTKSNLKVHTQKKHPLEEQNFM